MVGTTLVDIREHIETLAADDGEYYVRCGRTGERPIPTAGLRFAERPTAQGAARAAEQYRTALRRYDPRLPYYDLVVCQDSGPLPDDAGDSGDTERGSPPRNDSSRPPRNRSGAAPPSDRSRLVEFCHSVTAGVFETLSAAGYDAVETAVMDAYFDLAERLTDPDDLCLCLLESTTRELDAGLTPTQQADVLARAAERLPPPSAAERPVSTTFDSLAQVGLFGTYARSPWAFDLLGGERSVVVELSEYVLTKQDGRLPVLPIVLDLLRREPDWPPATLEATPVPDGWRLALTLSREAEPDGLVSAPIRLEVGR